MDRLEGKVAIITGGAGGIGKAAANVFISEGAEVIIMDLDEDSLIKTCEEIGSNRISYFAGDVTKPDDNNSVVELAKERYGGLDIFLANAGVAGDITTIEEYDEDQFDHVMAVKCERPFFRSSICNTCDETQRRRKFYNYFKYCRSHGNTFYCSLRNE